MRALSVACSDRIPNPATLAMKTAYKLPMWRPSTSSAYRSILARRTAWRRQWTLRAPDYRDRRAPGNPRLPGHRQGRPDRTDPGNQGDERRAQEVHPRDRTRLPEALSNRARDARGRCISPGAGRGPQPWGRIGGGSRRARPARKVFKKSLRFDSLATRSPLVFRELYE